ncbi:hypothetical protein B0H19DRAFT_1251984 [Mycena capillaripes]|nr:hypothetical protein B0H19DRAFT_1251984 [Mycena capillaripes]
MREIPADIWRSVAGFIPVAVLLTKLYLVNRAFLEIATEIRYQAINFVAYEAAKPLAKHVKESKLVQSVRVQPWIVLAKASKSRSWSSSTWKFLHACVSPSFEDNPEAQITRRLQKHVRRVADTIRGLPHLHKYHIDWDEGPCRPEFFSALLDPVISHIGPRLCTLTLKVPLCQLPSLPRLGQYLPNLQHLALTLHTGTHIAMHISQKMEGFRVFINSLLRNLRSLSIYTTPTSTYLDLGPLFSYLGTGQRLTSFTLCIPFDGGHLADPTPLRHFLIKHRVTLESLTLGTTRAAAHPSPSTSTAKFWIRDTVKNHPHFSALSHLALSLRPLRTDIAPLLRGLTKMRTQLRMLKLSERPLEYVELERILDALDNPPLLRVLSLRLRWLSPEIVDLIAARLPALSALELNFAEVVHQEPSSDASSVSSEDSYGLSRASELTLFCQVMSGKEYAGWNLTRLAVPESPRGQMRWLDALERAFVRCTPVLTSFEELVSV